MLSQTLQLYLNVILNFQMVCLKSEFSFDDLNIPLGVVGFTQQEIIPSLDFKYHKYWICFIEYKRMLMFCDYTDSSHPNSTTTCGHTCYHECRISSYFPDKFHMSCVSFLNYLAKYLQSGLLKIENQHLKVNRANHSCNDAGYVSLHVSMFITVIVLIFFLTSSQSQIY